MRTVLTFLASLATMFALGASAAPGDPVKAVYHINEGLEHAVQTLRNVRNHITTDPKARIVVVGHASGIDFMLRDAKDKNGNPFEVTIQDLASKGVEFRVCNITLQTRKIDPKQVIEEAKIVPSGVGEIARLQSQEGYAYLKP
jgi:intracellular sulfur oxidation DsrE/DsrF family protein